MMADFMKRFVSDFGNNKKLRTIIFVVAAVAIFLLLLSEFIGNGKKTETPVVKTDTQQEYLTTLENSITQLVGTIAGAGKTEVMITLDSGPQYVYAAEQTADTDNQKDSASTKEVDNTTEKYIIIRNTDGSEQAVLQTTIPPTVRGVVVVCEGGNSAVVVARITEAVSVALKLDYDKIFVTKMTD